MKLVVCVLPQVDALMQLSSLKILDLEFGEHFRDGGMTLDVRRWKTSCIINEVIAAFKSIPSTWQTVVYVLYVEVTRIDALPCLLPVHILLVPFAFNLGPVRCWFLSNCHQPYCIALRSA